MNILSEIEEKYSEYTEMCTPEERMIFIQNILIKRLHAEIENNEYLNKRIEILEKQKASNGIN